MQNQTTKFSQRARTAVKWLISRVFYPVILFITGTKRGSYREVVLENLLRLLKYRLFDVGLGKRRLPTLVEQKYDLVSGYTVQQLFHEDAETYAVVDGQLQKASRIDVMNQVHNEIGDILSNYEFYSILEVGVGELATLYRVSRQFGGDYDYFGVDLSLNRLFHGYKEFVQKEGFKVTLAKANALHLPFPDNSFDMIITNHCLECLPTLTWQAIAEICRISRGNVVLFEPSYQLGSLTQKIRMVLSDYPLNIPAGIHKIKNASLTEPFLLKNCLKPMNRTGCYHISIDKQGQAKGKPILACPMCHLPLQVLPEHSYYCDTCHRVYFSFRSIPLLDLEYSPYITDLEKTM